MTGERAAPGKVAYCTVPHLGGIYTVYQRIRRSLPRDGWLVNAVHVGNEHEAWSGFDVAFADDGVVHIDPGARTLERQARAFAAWVEAEGIDIVLPMSSRVALAAVPHLPPCIHVVSRCVDVTPYTYRLATANLRRLSAVVVTSARQSGDLRRRYGVPPERLVMIPNAVDVAAFRRRAPGGRPSDGRPLRLIFVDRIEDRQKSVFLLPQLLARLDGRGVEVTLDVIGGGPQFPELEERLRPWTRHGCARLHGPQPADRVPGFLWEADVLVKPTKFEGFPSSVIEAMAAGVVPVCSRIGGVTDWIIRDGHTGLLCPINRVTPFADAIERLHRDRDMLSRMATEAAGSVAARFGLEEFGRRWDALFSRLRVSEPPAAAAAVRPWSEFRPSPAFDPPASNRLLYRWLPRRLKDAVRARLEVVRSRSPGPSGCSGG